MAERPGYIRQATDAGPSYELGEIKRDTKGPSPELKSFDIERGEAEELKATRLQNEKSFLRKMRKGEEWLDAKLGIETRGIDRIPEEEKQPPQLINSFLMWWSLSKCRKSNDCQKY